MNKEEIDKVFQNHKVLDNKLDNIISELRAVKNNVQVAINNQQLIEQYEIDITDRLKRIENKVRTL